METIQKQHATNFTSSPNQHEHSQNGNGSHNLSYTVTTHNSDNVVIPDPAQDYHGHPNYTRTFISLLALLSVSLIVGFFFSPMLAVSLIFATAIWKTALVMKNFMHLKFEPLMIWIAVAAVIFCLFMFFFGIYPDITAVQRIVVPR
jgi:caa(3)-type oxidase subunit IV